MVAVEQLHCFDTVTVSSSGHVTQGRTCPTHTSTLTLIQGFSLQNRKPSLNRHHSDHQLGRLAALESAFRPNLFLGTQVAFFVTLRVLNYIFSIISLGG